VHQSHVSFRPFAIIAIIFTTARVCSTTESADDSANVLFPSARHFAKRSHGTATVAGASATANAETPNLDKGSQAAHSPNWGDQVPNSAISEWRRGGLGAGFEPRLLAVRWQRWADKGQVLLRQLDEITAAATTTVAATTAAAVAVAVAAAAAAAAATAAVAAAAPAAGSPNITIAALRLMQLLNEAQAALTAANDAVNRAGGTWGNVGNGATMAIEPTRLPLPPVPSTPTMASRVEALPCEQQAAWPPHLGGGRNAQHQREEVRGALAAGTGYIESGHGRHSRSTPEVEAAVQFLNSQVRRVILRGNSSRIIFSNCICLAWL